MATSAAAQRAAYLAGQVRGYLSDCLRHRELLDPKYHPTVAGCLKVISHQPEEKSFITGSFRAGMRVQHRGN